MSEFRPKQLITSVTVETRDLLYHEPRLKFSKVPKLLYGDSIRLKYILRSLIQTAVERNDLNLKFRTLDSVKVSVYLSKDEQVKLSQPFVFNSRQRFQLHTKLVVQVTDYGDRLNNLEIKSMWDTSVLR